MPMPTAAQLHDKEAASKRFFGAAWDTPTLANVRQGYRVRIAAQELVEARVASIRAAVAA